MANTIALVVVAALVVAWIAMLARFRFRRWTVLLSVLMLLFLFFSFFRVE
jgi:hypothetical protein